jgi:cytidylate kinase
MTTAKPSDTMITVDGPAGSGKSTVARGVAAELGFQYLDTGAIYRSATLAAMRAGIDLAASKLDRAAVVRAVDACKLSMEWKANDPQSLRVMLDGSDVTREIRTEHVTANIRYVADLREVRDIATALQRKLASGGHFVTEGRDQGTVVFPDAFLKIYLWASPEIRAKRRCAELLAHGEQADVREIERAIRMRDQLDMSREVGALKKAFDSVEVDSSDMNIAQAVAEVTRLARERLKARGE